MIWVIIILGVVLLHWMARKNLWFVSEEVKLLGQSMIDYPDHWQKTEYTFNRFDGLEIWFGATGWLDINKYPSGAGNFGIYEKLYLGKCIKKSTKIKMTQPKGYLKIKDSIK